VIFQDLTPPFMRGNGNPSASPGFYRSDREEGELNQQKKTRRKSEQFPPRACLPTGKRPEQAMKPTGTSAGKGLFLPSQPCPHQTSQTGAKEEHGGRLGNGCVFINCNIVYLMIPSSLSPLNIS